MLPKEVGQWNYGYGYFKPWRQSGGGAILMTELVQRERVRQGRQAEPSAGSIDSASIKAATQPQEDIGFDGNKRVKGRKRHMLVGTLGLILAVVVTAANVDDRQGLRELMHSYFGDGVKPLRKLWVDGATSREPCKNGCVA